MKFSTNAKLKELQTKLDEEMQGIQHMPTLLLFNHNEYDVLKLNLQQYEIIFSEQLHDISTHTKNLYLEITKHASKDMRASNEDAIEVSFDGKECKNSADPRKSILVICNWFLNKPKHFIKDIFLTMSKIQEILYKADNERAPQKIIRLSNLLFIHAMLLKNNVQNDVKHLLNEKCLVYIITLLYVTQ